MSKYWILFLLLNIFFQAQNAQSTKSECKVVIVGAGAAGISAAAQFLTEGYTNIVILEAENRIGGRIHTVVEDNYIKEFGAEW